MGGEAGKDVVVLVHGTFARDSAWTKPGSKLYDAVQATTDAMIERFQWSGWNSHVSRRRAGKRLAAFLAELARENPQEKIHVVAHSHGGNVVHYAMRDPAARAVLSSMTCVATPFIECRRRDLKGALALAWRLLLLFAVLIAATLMWLQKPDLEKAIAIPAAVLIGGAVIGRILRRFAAWILKPLQRHVMKRVGLPVIADLPVFCAQVRDDEASNVLGALQFLAGLPHKLWMARVRWLVGFATLAGCAYWVYRKSGDKLWDDTSTLVSTALIGSALSFIAVVLLLVASQVLTLFAQLATRSYSFGESPMASWLVDITIADRPSNSPRHEFRRYQVAGSGLRHSLLLSDANCLRDIVHWIRTGRVQRGSEAGGG